MNRWVTFDCYGTLADWRGGIRNSIATLAGERTDELLEAYFDAELAVEHELPQAPYREILAESLRRAAARTGIELPAAGEHALAANWADMPIFEDTTPALQTLRERQWKLAILTNCDPDLLELTLFDIGVPVDLVVTADVAGSYKPAPGHFHAFAQRTEGDRGCWVHAANSWVHDIVPARELDIPCVWVDRDRTRHDPAAATVRIEDLQTLPQALELIDAAG